MTVRLPSLFSMQEAPRSTRSESAAEPSAQLYLRADRPPDVHFQFEDRQSRVGVGASVGAHLVMVLLAIVIVRYAPEREPVEVAPVRLPDSIVWLAIPGPGGGGGGGGNEAPEPPRVVELPGEEAVTVPVEPVPEVTEPTPEDEPPVEQVMNIPARSMAANQAALPGVLESANIAAEANESQGSGTGGGAGTGGGSGVGEGQGSGLGPGSGGGTGGGAYRPGAGITLPSVVREVKPQYTADAMRAKVQGTVWLECVVMSDGTVGDVKVIRSLDPVFGLDTEAIKAARQWRFVPGMRQGVPVPVIITIELTFTLR